MIFPLLVGIGAGATAVLMMYRCGLLEERSGLVVLVCAVAVFYPVFAVAAGADLGMLVGHIVIFGLFCAASVWGFQAGTFVLAGLLILHGLFDIIHMAIPTPSPLWWPPFCAGVDIAIGAGIFALLFRKEIPA